ncbi:MAG TPA: hypothetical protein VLJ17_01805 [Xanthobacteraceae bacterium]|nr:hypothetical protein [Xanthobacteraceae bacterium]
MPTLASSAKLLAGGVLTGFACAALSAGAAAQQKASPPDFSSSSAGWLTFNVDFSIVPGGTSPMRSDPAHPRVSNQEAAATGKQPTYFIADLSNIAILKPWVVERMKKDNAEVLAGKIAFTPHSSCTHAGVPGFHLYGFQPLYFVQTPKEVVMIYSNDQQVRHVYLDVPHSANPTPSWYGESVGYYEGDTLVVDTIALNDRTFVNNFRTPHTEKLHVVERFKLVDDGKAMQVDITFEDPDAFNAPWSVVQRYDRIQRPMVEEICAENNQHLFDYHMPVANNPDF